MTRVAQGTRWAAALLILSLLPMQTYLGHWDLRIDIPGTDYYWGMPSAIQGSNTTQEHVTNHGEFCRGDTASCAGTPAVAGASFGVMAMVVALLGTHARGRTVTGHAWMPPYARSVAPELLPPRTPHLSVT